MRNILSYALILAGCALLLWAFATIIRVEEEMRREQGVKRVAIGPPIAIVLGILLIIIGAVSLYHVSYYEPKLRSQAHIVTVQNQKSKPTTAALESHSTTKEKGRISS